MERKSAWSLPMSEQEIVNEYKNAKKPQSQIAILADQNNCDKKTIVNILEAAGCELPGNYKRNKKEETLEETFDTIAEETEKLQEEPAVAEDQSKVIKRLIAKQEDTEEGLRSLFISSSKEIEDLKTELAPLKIKAAAYDTIVAQLPVPWDTDNNFALMIAGINDLVKKLIKEA